MLLIGTGCKLQRKKKFQMERYFEGSKNEFRQQFGVGYLTTQLSCSPETFKKIWGRQLVVNSL